MKCEFSDNNEYLILSSENYKEAYELKHWINENLDESSQQLKTNKVIISLNTGDKFDDLKNIEI